MENHAGMAWLKATKSLALNRQFHRFKLLANKIRIFLVQLAARWRRFSNLPKAGPRIVGDQYEYTSGANELATCNTGVVCLCCNYIVRCVMHSFDHVANSAASSAQWSSVKSNRRFATACQAAVLQRFRVRRGGQGQYNNNNNNTK